MTHYQRTTGWLAALLLLWLVSCGTAGVGTVNQPAEDDARAGTGVSLGGFEVVRYNADGFADPALNGTLQLDLTQERGQTGLVISVSDTTFTDTVALDVRFDKQNLRAERVEFAGAMGSEDEVLSAQFLGAVPGVAAIGQTGIQGYRPQAIDGVFATVFFAPGAARETLAAGDVHENVLGVDDTYGDLPSNTLPDMPNFRVTKDETDPNNPIVNVVWFAAWHLADGDQNGEVNISDISVLGAKLKLRPSLNWSAAPADYDGNDEVNISDLSPMGKYLGEGTTDYIVEGRDNGVAAGESEIAVRNWLTDFIEATDRNGTAVTDLGAVFRSWSVVIDDASSFTYAQLAALDANADGTVQVGVTPRRGAQQGVPAFKDVTVTIPPPPTRFITVSDVVIQVAGAADGEGGSGDQFSATDTTGSIEANGSVDISLVGITGTYSSAAGNGAFDAATLPADMTQQDYDDALAAVRAALAWTTDTGGAAGFRWTTDWITWTAAPPPTGDPGSGAVFPDDDPESTGGTSEGELTVNLAATVFEDTTARKIEVQTAINRTFMFDVTADPDAPILGEAIDLEDGLPADEFVRDLSNFISLPVTFGTAGPPADFSTTQLELMVVDTATGQATVHEAYTFTTDPVIVDGQFRWRDGGDGTFTIETRVSGLALDEGSFYHFRVNVDGLWSSINKPEQLISTAPPPPPEPLETVPERVGPGRNVISIFYTDPVVRRNGNVGVQQLPPPPTLVLEDSVAYGDILKTSGNEFPIAVDGGFTFPRITLVEGDDPDLVTADMEGDVTDTPPVYSGDDALGGLLVIQYSKGKIVVDVAALPPQPANGELTFVYKLFGETGNTIGADTFQKPSQLFDEPSPFAVNWSVNLFNRDNTALSARFHGDVDNPKNTVQGNTIPTPQPDVLWFEFRDGFVFSDNANNNVKAVIECLTNGSLPNNTMRLDLRVVGVTDASRYLAIHPLTPFDFYDPDFPGSTGNLLAGESYAVHLDDPTKPGEWQSTFSKQLFVGSNVP